MKRCLVLLALAAIPLLSGCASIVSKSEYPVTFESDPSGAHITISDETGHEIRRGTTPTAFTLPSSTGFFARAKYYVTLESNGCQSDKGVLRAQVNEWVFGNALLLFGAGAGVVVDGITGAMWKLPPQYTVCLSKIKSTDSNPPASQNSKADVDKSKPLEETAKASDPQK